MYKMGAISTYVMLILLHTINLCLHSLAFFLLFYIRRRGRKYSQQTQRASQQLFLMNFSASNSLKNLILILLNSAAARLMLSRDQDLVSYLELHGMMFYLTYINTTGVYYLYLSSIIYLAGDRVLTIFVSIKYPLMWSRKKTLILLACTWLFGFASCVIISVLLRSLSIRELYKSNLIVLLRGYVHIVCDIIFVIIAVMAYVSILMKYMRLRKRAKQNDPIVCREYFHIFINTNSYISIFLITTSIALFSVPNLIASFTEVTGVPASQISPTMSLYISMSQVIADTVSGVANIFLQKPVRKLLYSFLPLGVSSSLCENPSNILHVSTTPQKTCHDKEKNSKPTSLEKKNPKDSSYEQSNTTATSIVANSPLQTTDLSMRNLSSSSSSTPTSRTSSSSQSNVKKPPSQKRHCSPPSLPPPSPPPIEATKTLQQRINPSPATSLSYTITKSKGNNVPAHPSPASSINSSVSYSSTEASDTSYTSSSSSSYSPSLSNKKRPRFSPPSLPPPTPPISPPPEYSA